MMNTAPFNQTGRLSHWMDLATLVTAGAALLLAGTLLTIYQVVSLRSALVDDLRVQARIIGENSAAALVFNDPRAARETLSALEYSPSVQAAAIFSHDRSTLALYQAPDKMAPTMPDAALLRTGYQFSVAELLVAQPVKLAERQLGTVVLRISLEKLWWRVLGYIALTLAVAIGSLAISFVLVSRMRKVVRHTEAHLDYLAHSDSVTGLPNRHAFNARLAFALSKVDQFGGMVGLLFLDLDNFKAVNDTLGHQNGDRLLKLVAQRLVKILRTTDTICRIGGDEFAVILESASSSRESESVAAKLLAALNEPFVIDNIDLHVTASLGLSIYPIDTTDLQALTRNADTAMYQAKNRGKNAFERFHPDMEQRAKKRVQLENSMRRAMERNELRVFFQPQISIATRRIVAVEALLRWEHPELGLIQPVEFIPIAEESGLIVPLGKWVLEAACQQAARWAAEGMRELHMAVNLSVRQMREETMVDDILSILRDTGVSPGQLELEITETVLMENVDDNVRLLTRLKAAGVRIAVDDFGTGYSSMAYLKRFPIDQLKIDRAFITGLPGDAEDRAITTAIIAMAHSLGVMVVAEGVETAAQLAFLDENGCDRVQGYFLGAPLPGPHITALLRAQHENAAAQASTAEA
ncbi:MAG: EAL domain-containing protein [Lacisediminimonas sp.]|nr:EAL domain-containing protein [Lacisediminimonas sp.]